MERNGLAATGRESEEMVAATWRQTILKERRDKKREEAKKERTKRCCLQAIAVVDWMDAGSTSLGGEKRANETGWLRAWVGSVDAAADARLIALTAVFGFFLLFRRLRSSIVLDGGLRLVNWCSHTAIMHDVLILGVHALDAEIKEKPNQLAWS